ncbi:MAG: hypothetical protein ACTSRB_08625 [Candidatus Helarchaeota archaeon]
MARDFQAGFEKLKSLLFELNQGLNLRDERLDDIGTNFPKVLDLLFKNGLITENIYREILLLQETLKKFNENEVEIDRKSWNRRINAITSFFLMRFYHYL